MTKSKESSEKPNLFIVEQLRNALGEILAKHEDSLLMGEDIVDPYGGAFKVTKGLSTKYPEKVIPTPISEAGFVAVATGLSYLGFKPIVEIMFGDFLPLVTEILINHTSKFKWFSGNNIKGSIIIRFPVGGGRGYGPIHSQSLEKIFFGWPEIKLFAANRIVNNHELLCSVYADQTSVKLFIENKLDYSKKNITIDEIENLGFTYSKFKENAPIFIIDNTDVNEHPDIAIFCYGGMINQVLEACHRLLIDEEITSRIFLPSEIFPLDLVSIRESLFGFKKLFCVEEGYSEFGWGSYVLTELTKNKVLDIKINDIIIMGPDFKPIPANVVDEKEHFVSSEDISKQILDVLDD